MDIVEAREWLTGQRSSWNSHSGSLGDPAQEQVNAAREDAAKCEQAYWVLRAKNEGLIAVRRAPKPECCRTC